MPGLLIYGNDTQCLVTGYSDSDYAGDVDSRRSMTGYVFTLGGSAVSWKATLQATVTLSTTEAEYMALTAAAKEGIWLKGLVSDLGLHHDQATVYCDSLSAICLAKDQVHHERTKHTLVQKRQFASDVRRLFASDLGATPKPSTQMTSKRSASHQKRRRWLCYLRRTYIRCDAHCPAAHAKHGRAMCVAHCTRCDAHCTRCDAHR